MNLAKARVIEKNYDAVMQLSDSVLSDFLAHIDEYKKVYEMLSDDWSRLTYINLLAGNMLIDARYGDAFMEWANYIEGIDKAKDSALKDAVNPPFFQAGEFFVDCGAKDCDTLAELTENDRCPSKYYGYEPNEKYFTKAKAFLDISGINGKMINKGVWDKEGVVRFTEAGWRCPHVTEEGEMSINVTTLDETISDVVTMIKMDVEGSEYEALKGASRIIRQHKPKLVLSIYHKIGDYRKIPLLVKNLHPGYSEFYIRYISWHFKPPFGFIEVVLYVR